MKTVSVSSYGVDLSLAFPCFYQEKAKQKKNQAKQSKTLLLKQLPKRVK